VPDGVYTVRLHAVDAYGQTADTSVQLGVDTRTPGALTTPASGDTLAGLARFAFTPTSGLSVNQISISFDTGVGAPMYNASPDGVWRTSIYTGSLQNGPATLRTTVSYTDPFGVQHSWSAPVTPVTIDVTSLPLTVTPDPASGPAPLSTTFHIDTSDPDARTVHYTVDFGDGTTTNGDVDQPYPTTDVTHTYNQPGAYRAIVTVTNSAGAASTQAVDISAAGATNSPPTATLSLEGGYLSISGRMRKCLLWRAGTIRRPLLRSRSGFRTTSHVGTIWIGYGGVMGGAVRPVGVSGVGSSLPAVASAPGVVAKRR
jgi:hypothetical protein